VAKTTLRCHTCGSRAEIYLSETDSRLLSVQGYLNRNCHPCRGNTRWQVYEIAQPARLAAVEAEAPLGGRILLIDDDKDILTILEKALGREQFDLEVARSAREAVTLLARSDYDLILSDIRMPDFDGIQLFHFLDQHLPESRERVIFITADLSNPDTLTFLKAAKRPYLSKPIDIPALLETVRRSLLSPK
jgi:CheY-like chemotaxis protein